MTKVPAGHGEQIASIDRVVPAQDPRISVTSSTYTGFPLIAVTPIVMGVRDSGDGGQYVNGAFIRYNWVSNFCARRVHKTLRSYDLAFLGCLSRRWTKLTNNTAFSVC